MTAPRNCLLSIILYKIGFSGGILEHAVSHSGDCRRILEGKYICKYTKPQ
jgi:hypothetical protein